MAPPSHSPTSVSSRHRLGNMSHENLQPEQLPKGNPDDFGISNEMMREWREETQPLLNAIADLSLVHTYGQSSVRIGFYSTQAQYEGFSIDEDPDADTYIVHAE